MSDIHISADMDGEASADWRSAFLDTMVKVHVGVNDAVRELQKSNRLEQLRLGNLPNPITFTRSSINAVTVDVLNYGGPQPGRQWIITMWDIFASTLGANAAVPNLYIGQPVNTAAIFPASMHRWGATSLPYSTTFTGQVLRVLPNEQLFVGLTSIPASSLLYSNISVQDIPLAAAYIPVSTV